MEQWQSIGGVLGQILSRIEVERPRDEVQLELPLGPLGVVPAAKRDLLVLQAPTDSRRQAA